MEVMGGARFMDGEMESIYRILSFDQDSDFLNGISHNIPHDHQLQLPTFDDHHVDESLNGLLMDNANPYNYTTQHALPNPRSYNLSQSSYSDLSNDLSIGSLVNVKGAYCHQFVQPYCNDDDQVSSLSSSSSALGFLARNGSLMNANFDPMINGSTRDQKDNDDDVDDANVNHSTKRKHDQLEIQAKIPKKKARVEDNRKMQPRKSKKEAAQEEEQSESSDNESNGSQEVINEEAKERSSGKKRASRGGATDPQSLYARKRRERINERLRILQTLVPNGTKVDISTMLEEAVNYVKFLQLQIKLLSSDDMWMYASLAYNGFDVDLYKSFSPHLPMP